MYQKCSAEALTCCSYSKAAITSECSLLRISQRD